MRVKEVARVLRSMLLEVAEELTGRHELERSSGRLELRLSAAVAALRSAGFSRRMGYRQDLLPASRDIHFPSPKALMGRICPPPTVPVAGSISAN